MDKGSLISQERWCS